MRYTIRLANCAFHARHGVLPEEATLGQRFYVDAELEVEGGSALETDRIEGTVHYGEVYQTIAAVVNGRRRNLIETVAHDVGQSILERFPAAQAVEIAVRKPSVPIEGILDHAEVVVRLNRAA